MNSLEFIEKMIKYFENEKELHFSSYKEHPSSYGFLKVVKQCEEKLQTLQQIKSELEAWGVVKEDIEYQTIKYCDERPEYTYEYKEWSFKLTEDYPNFEEKSEKLKKALEVNKYGS